MLYATPTSDVSVRNRTLEMIADILVRTLLAGRTHIVCWSTVKPNAYVVKDSPAILASALTLMNALQIHVQLEPYAPTFQEDTLVNAQAVALVIPIQEDAPNPPYTLAMIRTHAHLVKSVFRMHTAEIVSVFVVKATNETPKAFAKTSTNARTRTNRLVVSTQYVKIFQEVTNANVHLASTEIHSCRAKNATAWNANALRHTSSWMEIVFWTTALLMVNARAERSVFQLPEVSVIVHARKASERNLTEDAKTLMNVQKINTLAVMMPSV